MGDPSDFGGGCPTQVDVWATIGPGAGGEATLLICNTRDCGSGCTNDQPLSAFPLIITNHLPTPDTCVRVQAGTPHGQDSGACGWGALSIIDPLGLPYVIATTHSAPLTPHGAQALGQLISPPVKAGSCNCDDIGQGNDCCYQADGPPEFWYYPFPSDDVFPGGSLLLPPLGDQGIADHYFRLFQAQRIRSCESQALQLSWAVTAKL